MKTIFEKLLDYFDTISVLDSLDEEEYEKFKSEIKKIIGDVE